MPETPVVLITAHGISNEERARLESTGRRLLDTTCPLVRRAHQAALRLDAEGCLVLVIGRRGHVEVRGLVGDLRRCEVVESPAEVRSYTAERLGVICQTTTPDALLRAVLRAVQAKNPATEIRFVDTVCRPTRERRQQALERLLPAVDALVVVGGPNPTSGRRSSRRDTRDRRLLALTLAKAARARGVRTLPSCLFVAPQAECGRAAPGTWFQGHHTVGADGRDSSTLESTTIEEVHRRAVGPAGASAAAQMIFADRHRRTGRQQRGSLAVARNCNDPSSAALAASFCRQRRICHRILATWPPSPPGPARRWPPPASSPWLLGRNSRSIPPLRRCARDDRGRSRRHTATFGSVLFLLAEDFFHLGRRHHQLH